MGSPRTCLADEGSCVVQVGNPEKALAITLALVLAAAFALVEGTSPLSVTPAVFALAAASVTRAMHTRNLQEVNAAHEDVLLENNGHGHVLVAGQWR